MNPPNAQLTEPVVFTDDVIYPDSDGKPMADNTQQFRWITTIKTNLDWLFAKEELVFIAGDLLWYPIQGDNKTRVAPDVMVVFGRPKGERGSYRQWVEGDIPPQVVFEILSPGNTQKEMTAKLAFYERHGVEEYYVYDPDTNGLQGWQRRGVSLEAIPDLQDWVSDRLGIRFDLSEDRTLQIYDRLGNLFLPFDEAMELASMQLQEKDDALQAASMQLQAKDDALQEASMQIQEKDGALQAAVERNRQILEKLRELGIDTSSL
jgi:Uma2 family endonuclease